MRPSPLYSFVAAASWPVLRGLFRLRAEGKENLPADGGFVLAANHISNLDPWPLGLPIWPKRFLRFMAKSELYWWPLGWIITAGGGFPVLALEAGVPLVPAAVDGTDRLTRLGPIRVRYGEPIPLDDLRGQDPSIAAREATDRLMAEIERLSRDL